MGKRVLTAVFVVLSATTQAKECTQYEAVAAESVTDYLDSWHNVYQAYNQFQHCDEGTVAEGFSEAVARLLVDNWPAINEYTAIASREPKFEEFVLRHIDATLSYEELEKIIVLTKSNCAKTNTEFCSKIKLTSEMSLKEARSHSAT